MLDVACHRIAILKVIMIASLKSLIDCCWRVDTVVFFERVPRDSCITHCYSFD